MPSSGAGSREPGAERLVWRRPSTASLLAPFVALFLAVSLGCEDSDTLPPNAAEALTRGWELLAIYEFDRAEVLFRHAERLAAPGSRELLMARFGRANTYHHARPTSRWDEAVALYREIVEQDPNGEFGAWSSLGAARAEHLRLYDVGRTPREDGISLPTTEELNAVAALYRETVDRFPTSLAADEAGVHAGALWIATLQPQEVERGIAIINAWLEAHPNSPHRSHAYTQLAHGYDALERPKERLRAMLKSLETMMDPYSDRADRYYRIAALADRQAGEPAIALNYYQKVIDNNPRDFRTFWCKYAITRIRKQHPEVAAP